MNAYERIERAERAAAGACEHLMSYVRATDEFMKVWSADDTTFEAKAAALDGLRVAHNGALDWAKAESKRIYDRLGSSHG